MIVNEKSIDRMKERYRELVKSKDMNIELVRWYNKNGYTSMARTSYEFYKQDALEIEGFEDAISSLGLETEILETQLWSKVPSPSEVEKYAREVLTIRETL